MAVTDIATVVGISLFAGVLSEAISWALVYRTDQYKDLTRNIDAANKKIEKKKDAVVTTAAAAAASGKKDKKTDRAEEQVKQYQQQLASLQFKSTFVVMFVMIGCFSLLSSQLDGVVVAKLPFEPFGFITPISHRNLPGTDFTEASAYFFYALCSIAIRPLLQKLLGVKKQGGDMFSAFMPTPPK